VIDDSGEQSAEQDDLIARLRGDLALRDEELAALRLRLESTEHELEDLRAIRDALTPPELPERPGLMLAAAFLPAAAETVSGDFYLVAEGPQESTVLVVGDVVGHGLHAARRAAFVRTAIAATAPYSDDPTKLLSWANAGRRGADLHRRTDRSTARRQPVRARRGERGAGCHASPLPGRGQPPSCAHGSPPSPTAR
jgi:hypothetical protein